MLFFPVERESRARATVITIGLKVVDKALA
jgi:hypothetical protein